jgi:hypothetical protein
MLVTTLPHHEHAPVRRRVPPLRVALVVTSLLVAGAACDPDDEPVVSADPCVRTIDQAAQAAEIRDQVELLDAALLSCRSFTAYDAQLGRHPGLIGKEPLTYVTERCETLADEEELVLESAVCSDVVAPATSTSTGPQVSDYVGQTVDGREVTISPSQTEFVDGKPAPIVQIVDIAAEDGCEGVEIERARWLAQVNDPLVGDMASVYAQHAANVLAFIGCEATDTTEPE